MSGTTGKLSRSKWVLAIVSTCAMVAALLVVPPPVPVAAQDNFPPAFPVDRLSPQTPNVRPNFVWVGMGDSYASGEGAPVIPSSTPEDVVWGPGDEEAQLVRRGCHRSSNAPAPAVNRQLQRAFPEVNFRFRHVACSGALIADFMNTRIDAGPDQFVEDFDQPAQLAQVNDFLGNRTLDALYMNIGGNDGDFGKIVTYCLFAHCGPFMERDWRWPFSNRDTPPIMEGLETKWERMGESFETLQNDGFDSDLNGGIDRSRVFITAIPDPSGDTDDGVCGGADFEDDPFMDNATEAELGWASGVALREMNRQIRDAASLHGWNLIDGHVDDWDRHGMCADVPFANTNTAALRTQGPDTIGPVVSNAAARTVLTGLIFAPGAAISAAVLNVLLSEVPATGISSGIAHPNAAGFRTYEAPILQEIRQLVPEKVLAGLEVPTNVRIAGATDGGAITIRWRDRSTTETRYQVRVTELVNGQPSGAGRLIPVLGGVSQVLHRPGANTSGVFSYEVQACNRFGCSDPEFVTGGNRIPRLTQVRASVSKRLGPNGQVKYVNVGWTQDKSVVRWYVEQTQVASGAGVIIDRRRVAAHEIAVPAGEPKMKFRITGCNWVGCSPIRTVEIDTSQVVRSVLPLPRELLLGSELVALLGLDPTLGPIRVGTVTPPVSPPVPTKLAVKAPTVVATPAVKQPQLAPDLKLPVQLPAPGKLSLLRGVS